MLHINKKGRHPVVAGLIAVFAIGSIAISAGSVQAQGNSKSSWVKLCDKATFKKTDKKTKETSKVQKQICLTHHERLDGNTGLVLVSAAIRKIEGQDKQRFMIMVPLGMAIPLGVQVKIDEGKPHKLPYSICTPGGCTAEIEADDKLLGEMKKGKRMIVAAINRLGNPIGFPVPLNGFGPALAGKPIDNKMYHKARANLLKQIEEARAKRLNKLNKNLKK